jgi:hypothetical protein
MLSVSNGRIWLCYRGRGNNVYIGPRNTDGTYTCTALAAYSTIVPITVLPPAIVAYGGQLIVSWCDFLGAVYVQRVGEDCLPKSEPVKLNNNMNGGAYPALGTFNNTLYIAWCDLGLVDIANYYIWWSKSTDCVSWSSPSQQKVKGQGVFPFEVARSPCAPCFCYENDCVTLCWIQQVPDPIYKCVLSTEASERIPVGTTVSQQQAWGSCQGLGIAQGATARYYLFVTTFNGLANAIYILPSDSDVIAFTLSETGDSSSKWAVAAQVEGSSKKVRMVWAGTKPDPDPTQALQTLLEECEFSEP